MSFCPNLRNIKQYWRKSIYTFLFYHSTFLHSHPQSISKLDKDILFTPHFENKDFTAGQYFKVFSMASNSDSHLVDTCLKGYLIPFL